MKAKQNGAALGVALLMLTGAACSAKTSTSTKATTTTGGKATTTVAKHSSDSSDSSDTSDTSDTGGAIGSLKQRLLRVGDLPGTGWSLLGEVTDSHDTDADSPTDSSDSSDTGSSSFRCDGIAVHLRLAFNEESSVSFRRGSGDLSPTVQESLGLDTEAKAKDAFTRYAGALSGCSHIATGDSGDLATGTIEHLDVGSYGDESSAYLMALKSKSESLRIMVVSERKGNVVLNLVYSAPASTVADLEHLLDAAQDRL